MKEIALSASARVGAGKGFARRTRMDGKIPAVVYGPEVKPMSIALDERIFLRTMKGATRSSIFALDVDGSVNKVVLREIQRDPVTSQVVHLDFHAVSMTKPINISVPIKFVGEPVGVKVDGGIMQSTMREIEIACLLTDIPEVIEVDVTELGIGMSIHISDLDIENVKILADEKRTIVVISAPTIVKEAEPEEGEEEEEGVEGEAAEGAEGAEGDAAPAEGASDDKKEKK